MQKSGENYMSNAQGEKRRVVLVSHCVLNQSAVVRGLERAAGPFDFVREFVDEGVGIVQLPCPELLYGGCLRPPMHYEQYDTPEYRRHCKKLAEAAVWQIVEYAKNDVECVGLVAIRRSPTCSVSGTRGVFMRILCESLKEEGLNIPVWEVPETQPSEGGFSMEELVRTEI